MTNKKWIYPTINILLYAVGFPVLLIISLVKSIEWNSYGMYGASSFAPFIVVIVLALITGGVHALILYKCKKTGKTGASLMVKLMVVPVAAIIGLMGIVDMAMPPILEKATSNTILYEDVVYDYQGTHEKLLARVNLFKTKNGMAESVKYTDDEFQDVFKPIFSSMDKAYKAFDQLAIDMALDKPDLLGAILDGSFPVMLAASLILKTGYENGNIHNLPKISELIAMNLTEISGIIKKIGEGGLDTSPEGLNALINEVLVTKDFEGMKWNIFQILGNNILAPSIDPNGKLVKYSKDDYFDGAYVGEPIADVGACLGYQDMAWLDGVPMMFFIPLMSIRNILYLFAALMALFMFMQMFMAEAYAKKFNTPFMLFMIPWTKQSAAAEEGAIVETDVVDAKPDKIKKTSSKK